MTEDDFDRLKKKILTDINKKKIINEKSKIIFSRYHIETPMEREMRELTEEYEKQYLKELKELNEKLEKENREAMLSFMKSLREDLDKRKNT